MSAPAWMYMNRIKRGWDFHRGEARADAGVSVRAVYEGKERGGGVADEESNGGVANEDSSGGNAIEALAICYAIRAIHRATLRRQRVESIGV
ncbi:hypothetical protein Scep_007613 [Stephania cephalantha]|uniref:Uncharacterized protein n=1 Tax=Stephania cephalantha TaxID=152367 RepID=A0AAP0PQ78_9MAGN